MSLVLALRKGNLLFERTDRAEQKQKLLRALKGLRDASLSELATSATRQADRLLIRLTDAAQLGSPRYFIRLAAFGLLVGGVLCALELLFLGSWANLAELLRSRIWWSFLFIPTLGTSALMLPLDAFVAHLLIRWSLRGGVRRTACSMLLSAACAYLLLAVGAAIASTMGFFLNGAYLGLSFVLSRIEVALLNPWSSSAQMAHGGRWISYAAVSASAAIMGMLASLIFFTATVLRAFPERVRLAAAAPMFALLRLFAWLDKRKVNLPLKVVAWTGALLIGVAGCFFAAVGL